MTTAEVQRRCLATMIDFVKLVRRLQMSGGRIWRAFGDETAIPLEPTQKKKMIRSVPDHTQAAQMGLTPHLSRLVLEQLALEKQSAASREG